MPASGFGTPGRTDINSLVFDRPGFDPSIPVDVCASLRRQALGLLTAAPTADFGGFVRYQLYDAAAECGFPGTGGLFEAEDVGFDPSGLSNEERARRYEADGRVPPLLFDYLDRFVPGLGARAREIAAAHRKQIGVTTIAADPSPRPCGLSDAQVQAVERGDLLSAGLTDGQDLCVLANAGATREQAQRYGVLKAQAGLRDFQRGNDMTMLNFSTSQGSVLGSNAGGGVVGTPSGGGGFLGDLLGTIGSVVAAGVPLIPALAQAGIIRGSVGQAFAPQVAAMTSLPATLPQAMRTGATAMGRMAGQIGAGMAGGELADLLGEGMGGFFGSGAAPGCCGRQSMGLATAAPLVMADPCCPGKSKFASRVLAMGPDGSLRVFVNAGVPRGSREVVRRRRRGGR